MVDLTAERVNLRVNMSAKSKNVQNIIYPRLSVNLTGLGQNLRVRYVINSYTSKLRAPGRTHTCINYHVDRSTHNKSTLPSLASQAYAKPAAQPAASPAAGSEAT